MEKISVLAITKNGVKIGLSLKELYPSWTIFAPEKFSNNASEIEWYSESTSEKIVKLFKTSDALICLFSLGAVIRLISPHIKDKKTDPAVLVIDDKTNFVISALSGHLGGANELTEQIAKKLGADITINAKAGHTYLVNSTHNYKKSRWHAVVRDETGDRRILKEGPYHLNKIRTGDNRQARIRYQN